MATCVQKYQHAVTKMIELPGESFWDPERCRDDVPGPMFVPWCYVPPVLTMGRTQEEECAFLCVHCHFFFFVKLEQVQKEGTWPLCDVCGLSFTLVATGHLPFATATEEDGCCFICEQHQPLEKKACSLCNTLVKKAVAGDAHSRDWITREACASRNTYTHKARYYPFSSEREYREACEVAAVRCRDVLAEELQTLKTT